MLPLLAAAHACATKLCDHGTLQWCFMSTPEQHSLPCRDSEAMWEPFRRPKEGSEAIKHTRPHAQTFAGQYRIILHKMLVSYWRNPDVGSLSSLWAC